MTPRSSVAMPSTPLPQVAAPAGGELLGTWVLETTAELRVLRAGVHQVVHGPRSVSGPVALVASELATNALRHGTPPATVTLRHGVATYVLDVADGAVDAVPVLAARRPLGEGGFGLYVVGRLADEVGWYLADGRKHVWAALAR